MAKMCESLVELDYTKINFGEFSQAEVNGEGFEMRNS